MEKFAVGPMLRESIGVSLRHGGIFVLAFVALGAAVLANTVLITRCVLSPACVPTSLYQSILPNADAIIWVANRAANWLICGFAIFSVVKAEAEGRGEDTAGGTKRRGFRRCVLYLASISASYFAIDAIYRLLAPILYPGSMARWMAFVSIFGFFQIAVWAYVDARFAPYIANGACSARGEGFLASWQELKGNRLRVFLLFVLLEAGPSFIRFVIPEWSTLLLGAAPQIAELERLMEMPRDALIRRMPDLIEFVSYVVISNLLCAGAIRVVYRRMKAASPEARAAVFD